MFLGIIMYPIFSSANTQIQVQANEISTSLSPKNPGPYEDVTITLSSYATDLTKADLEWKINGQTVSYGLGKTSYTLKTGEVDVVIIIDVIINPAESTTSISKKIAIYPSEIEIMWEATDGYTPPFYKGKSLPSKGSWVKIVAIPNTKTITSGLGNISYTWKKADSVVSEASGYNRNYYLAKNSLFETDNKITVSASSVSGDYKAEKTIYLTSYDPSIVFYKKSGADGILYNKALQKEEILLENEMTIVAEPYFMTTKEEDNFSYTWKINGNIVETPSKKNEMTVRPTSRGGYATISLVIKNLNELLQEATNKIKINL